MAETEQPVALQNAAPPDVKQLELFREFLKLQADEISLKRQRFEIDLQEQKNTHEISKLSIDAQLRDRQAERIYKSKTSTKTFIFIVVMVVLFLCFSGYALFIGKEGIVKQMGETVVLVVGGVASGYAYCLKKTVGKSQTTPAADDEEK